MKATVRGNVPCYEAPSLRLAPFLKQGAGIQLGYLQLPVMATEWLSLLVRCSPQCFLGSNPMNPRNAMRIGGGQCLMCLHGMVAVSQVILPTNCSPRGVIC